MVDHNLDIIEMADRRTRFALVVLAGDADSYYDRWQRAQIGQVNRELAAQAYLMARTASIKFAAMYKVYQGLKILVILTAAFVLLVTARLVIARLPL
jgi:hypothetical protein